MGEYGETPDKSSNNNHSDRETTENATTPTILVENIETTEEYAVLEKTLDQLDSCLDDMEHKNDSLNSKLKELLDSTLQIHKELTEQRLKTDQNSSDQSS